MVVTTTGASKKQLQSLGSCRIEGNWHTNEALSSWDLVASLLQHDSDDLGS